MPLVSPREAMLAEVPLGVAQAPPPPKPSYDLLDLAAAAFRQSGNLVTGLYEKGVNEQWIQNPVRGRGAAPSAFEPDPTYNPLDNIAGFESHATEFIHDTSPAETQLRKQQIRTREADLGVLDQAGGWGYVSLIAAGALDIPTVISMGVPLAPALTGASRATRIALGVGSQMVLDTATEAAVHQMNDSRTWEQSALNVGAGAVLTGALGILATRATKVELIAAEKDMQERLNAVRTSVAATNLSDSGSFGSAAVKAETLADYEIAKGGKTIAKSFGALSPQTRILTRPFLEARKLVTRLTDVPYRLVRNLKGEANPQSIEGAIKQFKRQTMLFDIVTRRDAFMRYKQGGGTLSAGEFSSEVATAMTRGDRSAIPEAAEAAGKMRKVFDEHKQMLKDVGIELPDHVLGAESWLQRVYNTEKIVKEQGAFEQMLNDWFSAHPKAIEKKLADGTVEKVAVEQDTAEIRQAVRDTVNHILGMPDGSAMLANRSMAKPLKSRVLDVPDELLAPWLVRDMSTVVQSYANGIAPEIMFRKMGFSSPMMVEELKALEDEFNLKTAKLIAEGKPTKELNDVYKKTVGDVTLLRDRMNNSIGSPGGHYRNWIRAARIAKSYNYVRLLGMQTLSSLSDYSNLIRRYGLARTGVATAKFLSNLDVNKMTRTMDAKMATAVEMTLDHQMRALGDMADELPRTRLDHSVEWGVKAFGHLSLMAEWNSTIKHLASILEQDAMLNAAKNWEHLSEFQRSAFAQTGLNAADIKRVSELAALHGEVIDGVSFARTDLWPDRELAAKVERSIIALSDQLSVTRGVGDLPRFMDNEIFKVILQFKSFSMASVNRTMIPVAQGLAHGDARTAMGVASGITLGALSYYLREKASGKTPDLSPDRLMMEGLNWTGMIGFAPEIWDPIARLGPKDAEGNALLPRFSRFKNRSPSESLVGPMGSTLNLAGSFLTTATGGDWTQSDVHNVFNMLPGRTLFYSRRIFNAIEGETGELTGADGATHQTFMQRLAEETPSK